MICNQKTRSDSVNYLQYIQVLEINKDIDMILDVRNNQLKRSTSTALERKFMPHKRIVSMQMISVRCSPGYNSYALQAYTRNVSTNEQLNESF